MIALIIKKLIGILYCENFIINGTIVNYFNFQKYCMVLPFVTPFLLLLFFTEQKKKILI